MQTTLRINDEIYHQVKAKSHELGLSITRFFEDAALDKLRQLKQQSLKKIELPVSSTSGPPLSEDALNKRIKAADLENDLSKINQ